MYSPRSRRGLAARLYCPNRSSLRSPGPGSVPPGPCTAGSLRSCTAAASSGIRSPPSAVPVSGTPGNRGNRGRGDVRSRRRASYSAASASGGCRRTVNANAENRINFHSRLKVRSGILHADYPKSLGMYASRRPVECSKSFIA